MLKNIDPLLSPDLLMVLRSMGHGDEIVVVDANFPAASMAQRLVRLDGLTVTAVTDAILSVMPLDDFVPEAAWRMEVVGDPHAEQPIFDEFRAILASREGPGFRLASLGFCQVGQRSGLWQDLGHEHDTQPLPRLPLSGRDHQSGGLVVSLL